MTWQGIVFNFLILCAFMAGGYGFSKLYFAGFRGTKEDVRASVAWILVAIVISLVAWGFGVVFGWRLIP